MKSKGRSVLGSSLIEMVMAMFLLAIAVAILAGTFPLVSSSGRKTENLTAAAFLGQQIMEESLLQQPPHSAEGSFSKPYERFGYRVEIEPWPESRDLLLLRIRIMEAPSLSRDVLVIETLAMK